MKKQLVEMKGSQKTKSEPAKASPTPVFTLSSVCTSSEPLVRQSVTLKIDPAK